MEFPSGEITRLLSEVRKRTPGATDQLVTVVYPELHRLAASYMRRERSDHTLQATGLVNEAFLKLVDQRDSPWQNRAHFFGIAANLMRRILVDHARGHLASKRGGGAHKVSLDHVELSAEGRSSDIVSLDDALTLLASVSERQSQIVEMRFFGGLSLEETAEALGVSTRTVDREWKVARAWLHRELQN